MYYTGDPASGYEGPGFECNDCMTVNEGDVIECNNCGKDNLSPVEISICPSDADDCNDDDHHFGRGDHVKTVDA